MRPARGRPQPGRGCLQHHPHGRGDRFEPGQLLPRQHPGVQVRQQPRLLEDGDGRRPQVADGRVVAMGVQPLTRRGPAILRTITQGEQRLRAAGHRAPSGYVDDLIEVQVGRGQPVRDRREGAVVAPVPAQPSQRDEHLRRVGDRLRAAGRAKARVPRPSSRRGQIHKIVPAGSHQDSGFHRVEDRSVAGPPQRAPQRRRTGRHLGTGPCRRYGAARGAGRAGRGLPRSRHLPT